MPRPKPTTNTSTAPAKQHAAQLRNEGNRMHKEALRLETESKLLLQAADVLDKAPKPEPIPLIPSIPS
jgi:hypothetical protein